MEHLPEVLRELGRKVTPEEILDKLHQEEAFLNTSIAELNKTLRELNRSGIVSIQMRSSRERNLYCLRENGRNEETQMKENPISKNEESAQQSSLERRKKLGEKIVELISFLRNYRFRSVRSKPRKKKKEMVLEISEAEYFPAFLGLFIAAARSSDRRPCCFVLPRKEDVALMSGLIHALAELRDDFPEMARRYSEKLKRGQRVYVHPNNGVYIYDGIRNYGPEFGLNFALKIEGKDGGTRSFNLEKILLLEPTERKMPRGRMENKLEDYSPGPLDRLMGVSTGGNKSIFENRVLFVCKSLKQFEEQLKSSHFESNDCIPICSSREYLPWGTISPDGKLEHSDSKRTAGEPVFAAHSNIEYVEKLCREATRFTRIVFSDTPGKFANYLQAFDTISSSQQLNIFATYKDLKDVKVLAERGCLVWVVRPDEVFLCDPVESDNIERPLKSVFDGARIQSRCSVKTVSCHSRLFIEASRALKEATSYIESLDDADSELQFMRSLYRHLLTLSSMPAVSNIEDMESLRRTHRETLAQIERVRHFLPGETGKLLRAACSSISGLYDEFTKNNESPKSALLREELSRENTEGTIIAAPNEFSLRAVRRWCRDRALNVDCRMLTEVMEMEEVDRVILTGWSNQERWIEFRNCFNVLEIVPILYDFEVDWLNGAEKRRSDRVREFTLSAEEKGKITGLDQSLFFESAPQQFESDGGTDSYIDIESILKQVRKDAGRDLANPQESKEAKYVSFSGDSYAYLTKTFQATVVSSLIRDPDAENSEVKSIELEKLRTGDYLLFREHGDSSIIRQMAMKVTDRDDYIELRKDASIWKETLRTMGTTSRQIYNKLRAEGFNKTQICLINWLENSEVIGPSDINDLKIIAKASHSKELDRSIQHIWKSITAVRSIHRKAGRRLTESIIKKVPELLESVSDRETKIELDIGSAWIVHIDQIEPEFRNYPANRVNRLNWANWS